MSYMRYFLIYVWSKKDPTEHNKNLTHIVFQMELFYIRILSILLFFLSIYLFETSYSFLRGASSKIGLVFARQYSSLEGWLGLWLSFCVLVNTCFFLF